MDIPIEKINIEDIFGEKKKKYNSFPVAFCSRCLSLNIKKTSENEDYCDNCGESIVKYASINAWIDLAKEEYGKEFVIE